ncbi:translation initiation factor SUI1 [Trichoderma gamsii]|uniref:Translation initiation factor SUI1 n=4 Tax=Trichoderma TaxID=5543 RepID=A0A2P4ZEI8_9HYPO|nr:translation initiation factor SUI1 [Trichoderma gamsii]PON22706.1 translation initiation factor SUI1 [Trichoderma gamsii]
MPAQPEARRSSRCGRPDQPSPAQPSPARLKSLHLQGGGSASKTLAAELADSATWRYFDENTYPPSPKYPLSLLPSLSPPTFFAPTFLRIQTLNQSFPFRLSPLLPLQQSPVSAHLTRIFVLSSSVTPAQDSSRLSHNRLPSLRAAGHQLQKPFTTPPSLSPAKTPQPDRRLFAAAGPNPLLSPKHLFPTRHPGTSEFMSIENLKTFDPFAEADDDTGDTKKVENHIHIRIQQRNGRKSLTTVTGLPAKFDPGKILTFFRKEFACNGNKVNDEKAGEVIQLQGDQRKKVMDFLVDKKAGLGLNPDNITVHGA